MMTWGELVPGDVIVCYNHQGQAIEADLILSITPDERDKAIAISYLVMWATWTVLSIHMGVHVRHVFTDQILEWVVWKTER